MTCSHSSNNFETCVEQIRPINVCTFQFFLDVILCKRIYKSYKFFFQKQQALSQLQVTCGTWFERSVESLAGESSSSSSRFNLLSDGGYIWYSDSLKVPSALTNLHNSLRYASHSLSIFQFPLQNTLVCWQNTRYEICRNQCCIVHFLFCSVQVSQIWKTVIIDRIEFWVKIFKTLFLILEISR